MPRLCPSFVLCLVLAAPLFAQAPVEPPVWEPVEVSGRIVDDSGEGTPRPGLAVRLERAPLEGSPAPDPVDAETDDRGVFRARLPEPGYWRVVLLPDPEAEPVTVEQPYRAVVEPWDLGDLTAGEPALEGYRDSRGLLPREPLPLAPTPLRVRVVEAETGRPIGGAVARYLPDAGLWGRSDGDGWLEIAAAPTADPDQRLFVHAAQRARRTVELDTLSPDQTFALEPAVVVAGQAVDGTGAGLAGVRVGLDLGGMGVMADRPALRTGADGAFVLSLRPGSPRLLARHPDRAPTALDLGELAPGGVSGVTVMVPAGLRGVGSVVDSLARPVAGATVELVARRSGGHWQSAGEIVTDANGRFAVDRLAEGTYDLVVSARGHADTWWHDIELQAPAGPDTPPVDLGVLALDPAARIVGQVTDTDRQPVPEAEVRWLQLDFENARARSGGEDGDPWGRTRTDADGRFEIVDLRAGLPMAVEATAAGHLDAGLRVTPTLPGADDPVATEDDPLLLVLSPAGGIVGRVEAPDGSAVPDARVSARPASGPVFRVPIGDKAVTDEDGAFELTRIPPGRVDVVVETDDWPEARETVTVTIEDGPQDVVVTLEAGGELTGLVIDGDGQPLPDAVITLLPADVDPDEALLFGTRVLIEETDDTGAYRFRDIPPGERLARVTHGRFAAHDQRVVVEGGANRRDFRLTDPGATASGRVVASDGTPVVGVRVVGTTLESEPTGLPPVDDTAADGTFLLGGLPAESIELSVSDENGLSARLEVDLAQGSAADLELVLGGDGRIAGRIVGLDDDERRQLSVALVGPSYRRPDLADDGTFVVEDLGAGEWQVIASHLDGRSAVEEVVLAAGQEAAVELDLTPRGFPVDGVLRVDGEPRGQTSVSVRRGGGPSTSAQTDYSGRFRLERMEAATYELSVFDRSLGLLQQRQVEIGAGETLVLDVTTVTVTGSVVDPTTGQGIAGVEVRLLPEALLADGDRPFVSLAGIGDRTDELGRFEIGPVGAQAYRLVVGGQAPATGQVVDLSSGLDVVGLVVPMAER